MAQRTRDPIDRLIERIDLLVAAINASTAAQLAAARAMESLADAIAAPVEQTDEVPPGAAGAEVDFDGNPIR